MNAEEQKAYDLAVDNHARAMVRVAELEAELAWSQQRVTDERAAFEYWLGINPCGAAHDMAWCAWQARAALSAAPDHSEQVRHMVPPWNLVADELPASGKTVLAFYLNSHGMGRRIRAMHVKRFTVEAEEFADPDTECVEYSEQEDAYYIRQGWYELIDNWDEYRSIAVHEGVITHWMPLPTAPAPGKREGNQ